jgi:hypothetical protein
MEVNVLLIHHAQDSECLDLLFCSYNSRSCLTGTTKRQKMNLCKPSREHAAFSEFAIPVRKSFSSPEAYKLSEIE